jgi:diguanylate cyclase (GGDEF)-like protein/PAS domain S-box-containing protein
VKEFEANPSIYQTLLESTRAIPWSIDWATTRFTYIGPQIEPLLGWTAESWLTVQDWAERIHEDERERVVNFCVSQSQAGCDHECDYRALRPDGTYVWIRDVVHVVRNADGSPKQLVGFMFDISERKLAEEQVLDLQRELKELSFKDGLTGVPNRRLFDETFEREWAAALTERKPLSLVMIDIDCFKQFNDNYGHVMGDDCIKRVSARLAKIVTRPRDFLARYGGEEFVLLLPNTNEDGARHVAELCRLAIEEEGIAHEHSSARDTVTVSAGVGTLIPDARSSPREFVRSVDAELYRAKQLGRNRVSYEGLTLDAAAAQSQSTKTG